MSNRQLLAGLALSRRWDEPFATEIVLVGGLISSMLPYTILVLRLGRLVDVIRIGTYGLGAV